MSLAITRVYTDQNFYDAFANDLRNARGRVIFQSPFLASWRVGLVLPYLRDCVNRGVTTCVFLQKPDRGKDCTVFDSGLSSLRSAGVHVTVRNHNHEKIAVVDETIFWDGSLNILSQSRTSERMTRWRSRAKVDEEIERYKLWDCAGCYLHYSTGDSPEAIGGLIRRRRRLLGIKQGDFAPIVKLSQATLSRVEAGHRSLSIESYRRVATGLKLRIRLVPECLLPMIDERIGRILDVD